MIGLFFGGLLKRLVGSAIPILGGIAIAATTFGAVQTVRIEGLKIWPLNIEGYAAANARLKADVERIKAAQKEAEAAQIAANLAHEAATARKARKADNDYQTALNNARGLAGAYASRMRVTAACRPARVASATAQDGAPEDRDGTSGGPDMVAVSREDFTTLTDNTIRLQAVHDWGQSLIKDGLALPEVGF